MTGEAYRQEIAAILICSGLLLGGRSAGPSAGNPCTRCAVYADDGAWSQSAQSIATALEAEGLSVRLLQAREIRADTLADFDALVVPGGNAWLQWQTLGPPGLEAISDFVSRDKAYVGVCAGAYLATDEVVWEEEDTTDYPLDLLDGVARGALDEIAPWPGVSSTGLGLTDAGRACGLDWSADARFFYQGGPEFSGLRDAEVLATYPGGWPAIVSGTFGRGRVSLTAVHFERPAGGTNQAPTPADAGESLRALLGL